MKSGRGVEVSLVAPVGRLVGVGLAGGLFTSGTSPALILTTGSGNSYAIYPVAVPDVSPVSCGSPPRPLWIASRRCIGAGSSCISVLLVRFPAVQRGGTPGGRPWAGGGGPPALTISPELLLCFVGLWWPPLFFGAVVAVWSGACVSTSVSWRLVAPHFRSSFAAFVGLFLCLRCWWTSTGGLGSLACCGGWRLCRSSTPFSLGFLGRLLLRDGGSAVSVFVGLFLAFVAACGVEADWVFLHHLN